MNNFYELVIVWISVFNMVNFLFFFSCICINDYYDIINFKVFVGKNRF